MIGQAFALASPHESVVELRLEPAIFQALLAARVKETTVAKPGQKQSAANRELVVLLLVSNSILLGGVVRLFKAAGLEQLNMALLSDEFLEDLKNLPRRNLTVKLLKRQLNEEIALKGQKNVVKARKFAEMLEEAVKRYPN